MATAPSALDASLWAATATSAPATSSLADACRADVAIIGGGYTGLSAALRLAECGSEAVVLEAHDVAWGASGRTGGQVIAGIKHDPDALEEMLGAERGRALGDTVGSAPDELFQLVRRHAIACDPVQGGWIQLAHSRDALAVVERRAEQWGRRGAPVEALDRPAVAALVGTDCYLGGWIDRRDGVIQPLSFARGLARTAMAAGATVYTGTRVTRLERVGARWRVHAASGAVVTAERVLLATNGYTDGLWPRLAETVIAANSFQVATAPLPDSVRRTILPGGAAASDTRRLVRYFRFDSGGRFVMGGRGPFREPRAARDFRHVERSVVDLFPQLRGVPFEHRWSGRVALTRDFLPHLHEPAPGVIACLGYNGRGVALATSMGRIVADYLVDPEHHRPPVPVTPIQPIPLHRLHRAYVSALIAWYRLLDTLG